MTRIQTVLIEDGIESLEAFVAYPDEGQRPLVILCHAWRGRDDFICEMAKEIAKLGYVGFAIDVYGKGVIGQSKEENSALKMPFMKDRAYLQRRLLKNFQAATSLPFVKPAHTAVCGFGFGGLCALDLARSGVDLRGAISIYGHFDLPSYCAKECIQTKVLILHGAEDPIAPCSELHDFEKTLSHLKVDWQSHIFGGAQHAFATPSANDPQSGILYHSLSAQRAWRQAELFLEEIFAL